LTEVSQDIKDAIQDLRNMFAHPQKQMIDMPGSAVSMFQRNVRMINSIFAEGTKK